MRLLVCVGSLVLLAAVGMSAGKPLAPPAGPPQGGNAVYQAPKDDGPVVALLDEEVDPLLPELKNDISTETGTIAREDRDVFAGVDAVRVTPPQKCQSVLPGWGYKIVKEPRAAGEFRFLRFAWKKIGGTGLMIQFRDPANDWNFRFHAGANVRGWRPSTQIADQLPSEWVVHTRDLFAEFGAFTITGIALTPFDGTAGLFDHVLLGRTVADLDVATDVALGRVKPAKPMTGAEREAHWNDLLGADRVKAAAAIRALLASAPDHVAFIGEQLHKRVPDKELATRLRRLVADLDADAFDVRDAATDALVKIGDPAAEAVRALLSGPANDEEAYRARLILRKIGGGKAPVSAAGYSARFVRVLERAGTAKARELLGRLAAGEYGFDAVTDAKSAIARLPKAP